MSDYSGISLPGNGILLTHIIQRILKRGGQLAERMMKALQLHGAGLNPGPLIGTCTEILHIHIKRQMLIEPQSVLPNNGRMKYKALSVKCIHTPFKFLSTNHYLFSVIFGAL